MQQFRISDARIAIDGEEIYGSVTVNSDGVIAAVTPDIGKNDALGGNIISGDGGWLLPGFIDLHVHGGFGADFMDASREAFDTITGFHAAHGTTTLLATTMSASKAHIARTLQAASDYRLRSMPYARLAGVHLEGPFISPKWAGAQNPASLAHPQLDWLQEWQHEYPGLIKQLTLAPELDRATELISWLACEGIIAAAGHTDATFEQMNRATDAGLRSAVHAFNACRGLHHREPGAAGAVLVDDRIHAELIADGHHVHPAVMRLLARTKPDDKLSLITDAISAAGLPDGLYELGGQAVAMKAGICRLAAAGNLAGSTLTMEAALRLFREASGWTVPQISRICSGNPARLLGLFHQTGSISTGKWADLVLLNESLEVVQTWIGGRSVYQRERS